MLCLGWMGAFVSMSSGAKHLNDDFIHLHARSNLISQYTSAPAHQFLSMKECQKCDIDLKRKKSSSDDSFMLQTYGTAS